MGTIFSRVKLSGKHVAALLALMLLSAVTAMLLPTALASMIDIGVAGENRNTILIIAAVMATLPFCGSVFIISELFTVKLDICIQREKITLTNLVSEAHTRGLRRTARFHQLHPLYGRWIQRNEFRPSRLSEDDC